jgi:hypothetical protein
MGSRKERKLIDNTTRSSPTRFHAPNPRFETAALAPTRLPDSSITKNARKPENKTVHWEGISASISSSYGFQIWAEKLAMLNGEVKSGSGSSPIPPVKQKERRASTARGPGIAVPRFLESPQTKN